MNLKRIANLLIASLAVMGVGLGTCVPASAQSQRDIEKRRKMEQEWRNIAIAAGLVGALGLLQNDKTLFFVGAAGALYSVHRLEQDRKSRNEMERLRAQYFSRTSFTRDGQRYVRRTVWKKGKKHFQFVKVKA